MLERPRLVRMTVTVVTADGVEQDVVLEATADAPLADVAARLADAVGAPPPARLSVGATALPLDATLTKSLLVDGVRVGLDAEVRNPESTHLLFFERSPDGGGYDYRRSPQFPRFPAPSVSLAVPSPPLSWWMAFRLLGWDGLRHRRGEVADYQRRVASHAREQARAVQAQREARLASSPDPSELLASATGHGPRAWGRRPGDKDFLQLRVGRGDLPAHVVGEPPKGAPTPDPAELVVRDVPVTVSLDGGNVLRLAGGGGIPGVAHWLVAQAAVLHGPADLWIAVFTGGSGWDWARWLPHTRPTGLRRRLAQTGPTISVEDLLPLRPADPTVLVVVDDDQPSEVVSRLVGLADAHRVAVLLVNGRPQPPAVLSAEVVEAPGGGITIGGGGFPVAVRLDAVSAGWLDEVARALAPLRDPLAEDPLPPQVRLLDLLDLPAPTADDITARWASGGRTTEAVLGVSADGPFTVDLRRDGPHVLVAGASGAGKSELVHSLVAGLAAGNRPDALAFLFVDYKGGSGFVDVARLPHTVGVITDLDEQLADRALTALTAEVARRADVLAAAGAADLDANAGSAPLPRLLIVVDEPPSHLPVFVERLSAIAQRGRPLGIHLLVTAQRREVSGLFAAADLRIALRTRFPNDSLGIDAAVDVDPGLPGRAYVRAGEQPPVAIQAGWAGGSSPPPLPPVWAAALDWARPPPQPPAPPVDLDAPRDIEVLVGAIAAAAAALDLPPQPPPWLPPLPDLLPLADLGPPEQGTRVVFGREDRPVEQAYAPAAFDLADGRHLIVAGAPRTGRTQFLVTFAAAAATAFSAADLHLYGVDSGAGGLLGLAELPHSGAVVTQAQSTRVAQLLDRLTATVRRRQGLLGRTTITAQRRTAPAHDRLPHLVLLLDRWESFAAAFGAVDSGRLVDQVLALLRDGGRVGVHVVLTGERQVLLGRFATVPADRLVFRMSDPDDVALVGLNPRDVRYHLVPGRALRAESAIEVQVAMLRSLAGVAAEARARDAGVPLSRRPFRVEDSLLVADRFHVGGAHGRPVGREAILAWLQDRHATGASAALLGPRRAGKSWVLGELARRLVDDGAGAVRSVVVPQPSSRVDTPDALAGLLDRTVRDSQAPAEALLDRCRRQAAARDRPAFLLDEVGRLAEYHPAAVSWLRDLGQAGAWLVYTGTEKDWRTVVRWALTAPGSSFGNDVNARSLGPLRRDDALTFLVGTAANLGVPLEPDGTAEAIVDLVGTWPFYLQVLGNAVVQAAEEGDWRPLRDRAVLSRLADDRLLDEWTVNFQARWQEIGPAGRAALLRDPGRPPAVMAPAQRADLQDVGLLQAGDGWLPDAPMLAWVARNATSLQDGETR